MFFDFVVQAIIDVSINIIMTKMQQMINQNQSTTVVDSASSQDEREFSEAAVTKTVDTSRFVSKKFDFFNSRYQNKTTAKASALENIDENIIYRDVHVFIFRIKNYFHIYDYQLIRDIFYWCLQNDVFIWHTSLLSSRKKRFFILDNYLNEWKSILINEFKKKFAKIMKVFFDEIFTLHDVEQNKKFRKYAQNIIRMSNAIELLVYNQLLQIWIDLNSDFQFHVFKSTREINLTDFIHELNNKKDSWWILNIVRTKFTRQRRSNNSKQRRDQKNKNRQNRSQQQRDMLNVNNTTKNRDREEFFFDYLYDNYQRFYYQSDVSSQQFFVSIDFQNYFNQFQNFFSVNSYQNRVYNFQQQQQQFLIANSYSNAAQQLSILTASSKQKQIIAIETSQNFVSNAFDSNNRIYRQYDNKQTDKNFHDNVNNNKKRRLFEILHQWFMKCLSSWSIVRYSLLRRRRLLKRRFYWYLRSYIWQFERFIFYRFWNSFC